MALLLIASGSSLPSTNHVEIRNGNSTIRLIGGTGIQYKEIACFRAGGPCQCRRAYVSVDAVGDADRNRAIGIGGKVCGDGTCPRSSCAARIDDDLIALPSKIAIQPIARAPPAFNEIDFLGILPILAIYPECKPNGVAVRHGVVDYLEVESDLGNSTGSQEKVA